MRVRWTDEQVLFKRLQALVRTTRDNQRIDRR